MQKLDLLDENQGVTKTILLLAWPTIAEQVLLTFVNYIDTAMVGSLGAVATAAISINASTIWLVNGLLSSLAIGFGVLVSKNIGAKNFDRVSSSANQGLFAAAFFGLCIFLMMLFVGPRLPFWLNADESVILGSQEYIKWITIAFIPQSLMIISSGIFRAVGNTKTPFIVNILNNFINVFLNIFLIFPSREMTIFNTNVYLKRANLGVKGAAIATCISISISALIMIILLLKNKDLTINLKKLNPLKMNWDINKKASILALPNAFERLSLTIGQIFLTAIVANLGTTALAAHYLAIQAESITYMPTFGFASAATTLVAQALGGSKKELAKKYARNSLIMGTTVMSIAGIFLFIFSTNLVGFFTNDLQVITSGSHLLRIVAICEPFFGLSMMVFGILRGSGDTKRPFVISIIGMWIVRLPLAYYFVNYTEFALNGAWVAMTLDLTVRGLVSYAIFKKGKFFDRESVI
ncbi:MAG: MATE family efflux transporter [Pleomorphochaeta sp.]